jgi:hypothetical protein
MHGLANVESLRRVATGLLAAAVLGLGLTAAVDGFRRSAQERAPGPVKAAVSVSERDRAAAALRQTGAAGKLTYSDGGCLLHALHLPSLRPAPPRRIKSCQPCAACGRIGVQQGTLASAHEFSPARVTLLEEPLNRELNARGSEASFRPIQAVQLEGERFAMLAESTYRPRERLLAGFDGTRLSFVLRRPQIGDAHMIRASPRGRYVAVLNREGVRVFTRTGLELWLPSLPSPHAIAWSPDERWTAAASRKSVYVFLTRRPQARLVRIPVRVRDLDWGPAPPAGERASLPLGARDLFRG